MNFGSLNALSEFWGIVREVNPEDLEREANQRFKIIVIGPNLTCNEKLQNALLLGQPTIGDSVQAVTTSIGGDVTAVPKADLYLYALTSDQVTDPAVAQLVNDFEVQHTNVVLVIFAEAGDPEQLLSSARYLFSALPMHRITVVDPDDSEHIVSTLFPVVIGALPNLHLSLGKNLPAFRERAAVKLIMDTSRVHAEFALFSSLPANIPVVGGLFATGADLLVLTKNQIMLVLKLALIYGKSHHSRTHTLAEIAPVVGGAFLWRTVARTLVGLLPGLVSAVPKTLVAFTGTFVVGNAARQYYQSGVRPTSKTIKQFYGDAIEEARSRLRLEK
jgi:uncharacterized protein (DUF697 family)